MHQNIVEIPDERLSEFAEKFLRQLSLPLQKTERPFVLYFIGMIGSGKTTTAKFFSEHYHLVRISTDEIRDFLEQNGYSRERSFDVAEIVAKQLLKDGHGVCFDADLVDQYFQDHVVALSKNASVQAILLYIQTPESVILERLREENPDRKYKGDTAIADYFKRKPKFHHLTINPVATIDGSGDFAEEMKRVITIIDKTKPSLE